MRIYSNICNFRHAFAAKHSALSRLGCAISLSCTLLSACAHAESGTKSAPQVPLPAAASTPKPEIVDDLDTGWIWSGMTQIDNTGFNHGSAHGGGPPTYAAYTFHGGGVTVVGFAGPRITVDRRTHNVGTAKISIDGKIVATALMERDDPDSKAVIYETSGLSDGNHVLQIAPQDGWIVIDYIEVRPAETSAAEAKVTGKGYRFISRVAPAKVMEVCPGKVASGALLDIASPTSDHKQGWHIDEAGDGLYKITPDGYSDLAVTVGPTTPKGGVLMNLAPYTGDKTQKWAIAPVGGGYYRLSVSGDTANCLGVLDYALTDGALIYEYQWGTGPTHEQWMFEPIGK